ncbi:uncharacterized protein LOC124540303 isoform X3 [Vanessa cardui]|uniref:uncharacterized protein LOC124540303 isoform X3 n=1 Tax=Vanessa cardui TaxID=171605 RepID=UPI001F12FD99|nr:uncharacterized protein LOC124540303 isoform X3 [Vanessa cardui]
MDAQILAMVAPQVQPLHNPYDDAAFYFGDTEMDVELAVPTETMGKDERASDCNALDAVPSTSTAPVNESNVTQKRTLNSPAHNVNKAYISNSRKSRTKNIKKEMH